jgi:hypothetical protein
MKYTTEMGSDSIIYVLSFIKIGLSIQKSTGEDTKMHSQHGDLTCLFLFLKNKKGG